MQTQDIIFQNYNNDIFDGIHQATSDYEVLQLGIELLKIARDRLDKDLDNKDIYFEYRKLDDIVYQLNDMLKNYK